MSSPLNRANRERDVYVGRKCKKLFSSWSYTDLSGLESSVLETFMMERI